LKIQLTCYYNRDAEKIARGPNTKDLKKVRISLIRGNYQTLKETGYIIMNLNLVLPEM
jgi:hypothetical protein